MKKILFILSFLFYLCNAEEQSKFVYLNVNAPQIEDRELYVGEKIEVKYTLLLLSDATLTNSEFILSDKKEFRNGVRLLNPKSRWKKVGSDTYEKTLLLKIRSPRFAIPALKVTASTKSQGEVDTAITQSIPMSAVSLSNDRYCGVVSQQVKIENIQAKKYDEQNNIVVFDISSVGGNLEDFSIPNVKKQGYSEKITFKKNKQSASYYVVVDKGVRDLKINYFNLKTLRHEDIVVPIVVKDENVVTQLDLEPKNNSLVFSSVVLIVIASLLLGCAFYFRKKRILAIVLSIFACGLIVYVCFEMLGNKDVVLKQGGIISILPTRNSTILERVDRDVNVEVIGERGEYYKVKLGDSRIGWIKKDECK